MRARGRSGRLLGAAIVVLALLAGCGGVSGEQASTSDEDEADGGREPGADRVDSGDEESGGGGDGGDGSSDNGSGGEGSEGLAWVPFGPSDPDNPTPSWPVYKAFASGDCAALDATLASEQSVGAFGEALSALCAAAVDGDRDQWPVAAANAGADTSGLANDCLAPVLRDMLDRALAWHAEHPQEDPDVQFINVEGTTACAATTGPDALNGEETEPVETPGTEEPETSSWLERHPAVT